MSGEATWAGQCNLEKENNANSAVVTATEMVPSVSVKRDQNA